MSFMHIINDGMVIGFLFVFFFFKQKTAYEMRISDWSSDVCSSDLKARRTLRWNWTQRLTRSVPPTWLLSGRGRNGLALDTGRLSGRSTGRCRWGVMWRERHDRRLSRFEGLPARQAFDLGRALPGLPRETAQSQREDIGAGRSEEHTSELQTLMRNSYDVF